jgi:hypothetical protein
MKEELKKLIDQAYEAGYLHACWCDGANVSNEEREESEEDLRTAVDQFLEKHNDKTTST